MRSGLALPPSLAIVVAQQSPAAPYVTKTEGWLNLALKRVITMAVQGGYDKVAFVTGEQSAERYDLSKQVDSIHVWGDAKDGYYFEAKKNGRNAVAFDKGRPSVRQSLQTLLAKLGIRP